MTLYEKRGRRYYPAAETMVWDSLPQGTHVICIEPGSRSVVRDVSPDFDGLDAALLAYRYWLVKALVEASRMRPQSQPLTEQQVAAWRAFEEAMGETGMTSASAAEVADAATKALREAIRDESM